MHYATKQPVDSVKRDLFSLENWLLSIYFGLTQFKFFVRTQNSIFMWLPRMNKKKNEYVSTGNTRICREGNKLNIVWEFEWLIKNFSKSNGLMNKQCVYLTEIRRISVLNPSRYFLGTIKLHRNTSQSVWKTYLHCITRFQSPYQFSFV